MLVKFTDVLSYRAHTGDESFPVTDVLFDSDEGKVGYIILDLGGWFDTHEVLVSRRQLSTDDDNQWNVAMCREALDAAPRWTEKDASFNTLRPDLWPPLIVGPFGNTHAPLAIMTAASEATEEEQDSDVPAAVANLERARMWIDREAFGDEGEIGRVSDFLIDTGPMRVTHVVIDDRGGFLNSRNVAVPFDLLRYSAGSKSHAVFGVTGSSFAEMPTPQTVIDT